MENGDIPDSNLAATVNSYDNNPTMFGAHRARLNSPLGFRTDPSALNSQDPFILVELPKEMIVTGVATQGLGEEWVTSYNMIATDDNGAYVYFRDVNTPVKVKSAEARFPFVNSRCHFSHFSLPYFFFRNSTKRKEEDFTSPPRMEPETAC